ncbi:MAG: hypothetical protein QXX51_00090 [Candidatus Bathyarchaeia archaeon]
MAKEIEHMFKYRLKDVTSVKDLELISALITRLTEQLADLAMLQYRILVELKDASFYILYVPLHTTLEFNERTLPLVGQRLQAFESEVERLKKSREKIVVEVRKEYEEAMKELTKMLEERKRKEKGIIV